MLNVRYSFHILPHDVGTGCLSGRFDCLLLGEGRKGGPKTAQKYAKKPKTASDFFPNTGAL